MPRAATPSYNAMAALPLPADIRLMNGVASAVYAVAAVGALIAGVLWLMRSPLFHELADELTLMLEPA